MLMADTVMDADEPRFQIGEDEMDDRQIVLGNLWVAALGNGKVFIPALAEAGISTPIVSDGQRPRSNGALIKWLNAGVRRGTGGADTSMGDDAHSQVRRQRGRRITRL